MNIEAIVAVLDSGNKDKLKRLLLKDHKILMETQDGFTRSHLIASTDSSFNFFRHNCSRYLGKEGKDIQILKALYSSNIPLTLAYSQAGFFLPQNTPLSLAIHFNKKRVSEFLFQVTLLELLEVEPEFAAHLDCNNLSWEQPKTHIERRMSEIFSVMYPFFPKYKYLQATEEQMASLRIYGLYASINKARDCYQSLEPSALAVIYALKNSDENIQTKQEFVRSINELMKFGKESSVYKGLLYRSICKSWVKASIICGNLEIPVEIQKKIISYTFASNDLIELYIDYYKITNQRQCNNLEQKAFKAYSGAGCTIV